MSETNADNGAALSTIHTFSVETLFRELASNGVGIE